MFDEVDYDYFFMTHLKYFLRGNITDIIADAIVISTNEGKSIFAVV